MRTSFLSDDTICAVATAPGVGAIAVIRLSGPQAHEITCSIFRQQGKPFPKEKIQGYRSFYGHLVTSDTANDLEETLDEVLVTFFVAPHSFTGRMRFST